MAIVMKTWDWAFAAFMALVVILFTVMILTDDGPELIMGDDQKISEMLKVVEHRALSPGRL